MQSMQERVCACPISRLIYCCTPEFDEGRVIDNCRKKLLAAVSTQARIRHVDVVRLHCSSEPTLPALYRRAQHTSAQTAA
jgi:hypothetical protein